MGAPDADLPQPRHETAVACEDYHRLLVCPGEQKFDCLAANRNRFTMSAQEIIAELSKLEPIELQLVKQKLQEWESLAQHEPRTRWGQALLEITGTAEDLPADFSVNHDHYLYGTRAISPIERLEVPLVN
jgi:hypothetical protein